MTTAITGSLSYSQLALILVQASHKGAQAIMPYYGDEVAVETKSDESPVTAADKAAEKVILSDLSSYCPDIPVVAEESASAGDIPDVGDMFFLVDPLDGTREFINQRKEFTVNIGLIKGGRPIMGCVYAPALGSLFATLQPGKAFAAEVSPDADLSDASEIDFREIRVRKANMDALTVVASRSHLDEKTEAFLEGYKVAEKTPAGSSIKFCKVATGEADLYPRFGRTMEWDTAAGDAVLTAAGGAITDVDGNPFLYGKASDGFANPGFICWGEKA